MPASSLRAEALKLSTEAGELSTGAPAPRANEGKAPSGLGLHRGGRQRPHPPLSFGALGGRVDAPEAGAMSRLRTPLPRHQRLPPSALLWQWRHFVIALCVGTAVTLGLYACAPPPPEGKGAYVLAAALPAGTTLSEEHLTYRELPPAALPDEDLADESIIGSRLLTSLPKGMILSRSLTTANLSAELGAGERLVEVPIAIGSNLAAPGARVDVIGPREGLLSENSGDVLCRGARVVTHSADTPHEHFTASDKLNLVVLAVPEQSATPIVGAATQGALGIVLSP